MKIINVIRLSRVSCPWCHMIVRHISLFTIVGLQTKHSILGGKILAIYQMNS